jgi:prophage regulatory protein
MHVEFLPETGFVRLPQILAVFPVSKSHWWAGVKAGRYPAAVKLGACRRMTAWRAEDIRSLLARTAERQGGVQP